MTCTHIRAAWQYVAEFLIAKRMRFQFGVHGEFVFVFTRHSKNVECGLKRLPLSSDSQDLAARFDTGSEPLRRILHRGH